MASRESRRGRSVFSAVRCGREVKTRRAAKSESLKVFSEQPSRRARWADCNGLLCHVQTTSDGPRDGS
jgi:hypothetical protein